MAATGSRRSQRLTDVQVREKIASTVERPHKAGHLTAAAFVLTFLALTLRMAVPIRLKETAAFWATGLWIVGLIWTGIAALEWKTSPSRDPRRDQKEQECQHHRMGMIWFHVWKGGYLLLVSTFMLLIGLGLLMRALWPAGWMGVLAGAGYLLAFAASIWQRRRILQLKLGGWSADTRWGGVMLRPAVIGPVAGASVGSGIVIGLVRLHILPQEVLFVLGGVLGALIAYMIVPQVVLDLQVAWIHGMCREKEKQQANNLDGNVEVLSLDLDRGGHRPSCNDPDSD
jgi:hypothetical protein